MVSKEILGNVSSRILCFNGEMGAGKTTLIKALVRSLGGGDQANSPTFGIVNEYQTQKGELLGYHFDFYRLESEGEALDLGLEDYFSQDTWVFIEWPEKIGSQLPQNYTRISLEIVDPVTRKIEITKAD
ncbi:tRNA (adenosine(37)-N6)-threonylcarbamoyltransferase complex ATPase subunit type 1 TsaE [uncultured Eudoraea sp.]|uniref:tRNA (adenosine(37)-N6)-threonylcarbamoyltransferase complex ATPase subunit type 1 TsaE n=1 Tax=uncultured Eudoraea sp. TaxID=1035614 RepID=UPI0026385250|nr:tRNA (adenosine(37)-N6)-threonylcarbamoyltransferase complex ATPase subunit type 1 TsaE [uncultured Eudoraea sp.]